jgi:hypothetical protein
MQFTLNIVQIFNTKFKKHSAKVTIFNATHVSKSGLNLFYYNNTINQTS